MKCSKTKSYSCPCRFALYLARLLASFVSSIFIVNCESFVLIRVATTTAAPRLPLSCRPADYLTGTPVEARVKVIVGRVQTVLAESAAFCLPL